jgi:hypothetical protein
MAAQIRRGAVRGEVSMKDIDIQHTNGKLIKIEWHHYNHGDDKPIMRVLILQRGAWVVIFDHNINSEV